ncbi:hypothetical protein BJX68DRAFT_131593 [Aspergillus pseudodeflectus]|uniref:Uncharacterized protein n=1 Tax=Aspergillus pseudodeflectus TaxID=176178 RepID=A0ABR4K0G9_9EURO
MSFHPRYRISEKSFIISASILLGLATLAVLIRCLIRFFLQRKRFALDDGLVLASFAFLLSTFVIAYIKVIPAMYFDYNTISATEDNEEENLWLSLQAQAQETGYQLHLWVAIANTASCAGILAAKLSFLFFFRTLIDRTWTRVWQVYWWVVTIFTGRLLPGLSLCSLLVARIFLIQGRVRTCLIFFFFLLLLTWGPGERKDSEAGKGHAVTDGAKSNVPLRDEDGSSSSWPSSPLQSKS